MDDKFLIHVEIELNKTTNRFVFLTENVRTHKRPFKLKSEQPSFQ